MAFTLYWLPHQIVRNAGRTLEFSYSDPVQTAGLALLSAGLAIGTACAFEFAWTGQGTPAPFDPPRFLVTNRLYVYVRNPMYIGALMVLFGQVLIYRPFIPGLLWYALGFWAVVHFLVLLYEEPTLRKKFGKDYEEYCLQVPRWIPRLKRISAG
ncbi:MAG: isoprenylcysteine carboxylmethyltransferase family protein [Acidobacteriales bacterium]|nr:isoprenylcysteine carboxylmethyltransferase family protein [Terriglobales bacterium]